MTLVLTAIIAFGFLHALTRTRWLRAAADAPALTLAIGALAAFAWRVLGAPAAPAEWVGAAGEAGLAALVFVSAAQVRVSRLARQCPAAFRLTIGAAPLFLLVCALSAFILLPQLSAASAALVGAALMLNGAAFNRRAVTAAPAPRAVKAAVRLESAAIIALGAPIAILLAGFATGPGAGEHALAPLLETSLAVLAGFALGGVAGYVAAKVETRRKAPSPQLAVIAGFCAFIAAALLGADPVIAAGAAGLLWGEETRAPIAFRMQLRRRVERTVPPAAYFLFGCAMAPRLFDADMLTVIYAIAAATVMRAGPRLAMLQSTGMPKESQVFLAWFGGAPGAASALFMVALLDNAMIADHEAVLAVGALAVTAGVVAARLTSRPLANAFLRQTALARKRRMFAA